MTLLQNRRQSLRRLNSSLTTATGQDFRALHRDLDHDLIGQKKNTDQLT